MADALNAFVLSLGSVGWATDLSPQARSLTHYTTAQNIIYEQSGVVRKVGGNVRVAAQIADAPRIVGIFDFWKAGTGGSFSQYQTIVCSNGKVYREDMDRVYDELTGTVAANINPIFCQAKDWLLIFYGNQAATPQKWVGGLNVISALGGTPPATRGGIFHTNRIFAWGANANRSRLYYCSSTDIEDWSGGDTGSIDISADDGDAIIGCVQFKGKLIIFKGPNKGSIWVLSGTAPTGSDAYSLSPLTKGIAIQTHNSIIPRGDDIWFMSNRGIHSLTTTAQYGDFQGAFLTRFLSTWFRDSINKTRLEYVWGLDYSDKNCCLWVMPAGTSTSNNRTFGLSYGQLQQDGSPKAFLWTHGGECCATRLNPTTKVNDIVFGGLTGYVTFEDQVPRSLEPGTAYSMRLSTPALFFAETDRNGRPNPYGIGTLHDMAVRYVGTGPWNVNVSLTLDAASSVPLQFNQGPTVSGGGFILGTSRLGIDSFGGGALTGSPRITFAGETGGEVYGEARSFTLDITQGGDEQDAALLECAVFWTPSAKDLNSTLEN